MSRKIIILVAFLMSGHLFMWGCLNENEEPTSEEQVPVIPEQLPTEEPGSATIEQPPPEEPTPFVPEQPSGVESKPVSIINVDDFAADPTAYHGTIGLRGIVAATNRADASFVIIDVREYELCGVLTCAANEITIRVPADKYSGELPRTEDIIIAYGEFSAGDSFGMIQVSRIERDNQVIIRQY